MLSAWEPEQIMAPSTAFLVLLILGSASYNSHFMESSFECYPYECKSLL